MSFTPGEDSLRPKTTSLWDNFKIDELYDNRSNRRESDSDSRSQVDLKGCGATEVIHFNNAGATEGEGYVGDPSLTQTNLVMASIHQSKYVGIDHNRSDNNDGGLAVAIAVADENCTTEALEYFSHPRPPLHRNRRFRMYTCFALVLVGVFAGLASVYLTAITKNETTNEYVIKELAPSGSPTYPPTSGREASGIIEQLQAGVLLRGEIFDSMAQDNPRMLALQWILFRDGLQLISNDVNLYQRYILAIMAYSFDSFGWYVCGELSFNSSNVTDFFPESECSVFNPTTNVNETFGVWLSSTPECNWYGVLCSNDGVVRGVELLMNDLMGTIPQEIIGLNYMQMLALPHNCIYGTIPKEIGLMTNLLSLELQQNGLSGEIPKELFDLENLQLLSLAVQYGVDLECQMSNGSTVNPFYRMGGLTTPIEDNSGLTGMFKNGSLGQWKSMKGLHLFENAFDGIIDPSIGDLRYLTFLRLYDNFMRASIPTEITKLKKLREFLIDDNFIYSELPVEIGLMEDLEQLVVSGNSMYGNIPESIYNLTKLKILRLDNTLMAEYPWLVTSDEGFSGTLSTSIGKLKDLSQLLLSSNPLNGTIPSEIGLLENLALMRIHSTNIKGTMPMEICLLRDKMLNSENNVGVLYADCRPNNRTGDPYVTCSCCTDCCDHTTEVCIADD